MTGTSPKEDSKDELDFIVDTRLYFSRIGLWPSKPDEIDAEGWLSNFRSGDDRRIATLLLDSYILVSTKHAETMVQTAFHALSTFIKDPFTTPALEFKAAWAEFREQALVTFPGSGSDPTGSGHIFARHARTLVTKPSDQIKIPRDAVQALNESSSPRTVVFVDDFAGSGDQFYKTWIAKHQLDGKSTTSFEDLEKRGKIERAIFLPAIATWRAKAAINEFAPSVFTRPAHLLTPRFSANEPQAALLPSKLMPELENFLKRYASKAGYDPSSPFGYSECGLALSFEHGTPDNTLPIFNGGTPTPATWRPLRRI